MGISRTIGRRIGRRRGPRIALPLLLAVLPLAPAAAGPDFEVSDHPPEARTQRPRFMADASSYLGRSGPEVLLAFQVPYPELFFRPEDGRYRSTFDLILVLYRGKDQVGGDLWRETRSVIGYPDTRVAASVVRRVEEIATGSGRFKAEVTMRETDAGRENRMDWEIEVPDYAHLPLSISSLWVAEGGEGDSISIPPRSWMLQRRFGEPLQSLSVVGEVYRPSGDPGPIRLTWRILGSRNDEVRRGDLTLPAGRRIPFRIRPDLSSLWLGNYQFELDATCGDDHARRRFPFQMEETSVALELDPGQSLDLVGIIATPDEMKELRDASPGERREAWDRFWKRHDPTPETPENEFKDEFFARVRYADEHFSSLGPGWKTDRGRIYIQYGQPDQVESYPDNANGPPYEIWTYSKIGRRFVFVDYDGFGRYELYQPGRS